MCYSAFPLEDTLRTFLALPITVALGERHFSKFKIINKSKFGHEKLSNMNILSIEKQIPDQIDKKTLIFCILKSRKEAVTIMY